MISVSTKMAVKFYDFGKFGRGSALIFEIFGIYFSFVLKWSSMPSLEKNYFGSISVSIIWNNPNISMHFLRKFFRFLFIYIFTDWLNQFGSWLAHTAWQEYSTTQTLSFLIFPGVLKLLHKPHLTWIPSIHPIYPSPLIAYGATSDFDVLFPTWAWKVTIFLFFC